MTPKKEDQSEEDTYSYKGWIVSDKFWKRSLAVFGYGWIPALVVWFIAVLFTLMFALS